MEGRWKANWILRRLERNERKMGQGADENINLLIYWCPGFP